MSLVVVGASLAGLSAARSARTSGYSGEIVCSGRKPTCPTIGHPCPRMFCWPKPIPASGHCADQPSSTRLRIDLRLGQGVVGTDFAARALTLAEGAELGYQHLIVATGASPTRVPLPGHRPIVYLRTWDDALQIRRALKAARRLVIVGAGLIGSEVAAAARSTGADVTMVDLDEMPLRKTFGEHVAARARRWHIDNGVTCIDRATIDPDATPPGAVQLSDGTQIKADLILCAVGVRPNTSWLNGSGLQVDDGVLCDRTCTASDASVLAAGDVARMQLANDALAPSVRLEHRDNARQQGVLAGMNAWRPLPERAVITSVPYAWSDLYDHKIQTAGWPSMASASRVDMTSEDSDQLRVLYYQQDRLIGAVVVDRPQDLADLRADIGAEVGWSTRRRPAPTGAPRAAR